MREIARPRRAISHAPGVLHNPTAGRGGYVARARHREATSGAATSGAARQPRSPSSLIFALGDLSRVVLICIGWSLARGAPRAVVSDGDVAAVARARPDGRGGLPSLLYLIALGRGGPTASTAGGGSVATVHGTSPFDPDHANPAATDRAVASDQGLTGTTYQQGPGGPANTPRDMLRRRGVFSPPRRRDTGANRPP